jgi:hypothetical protein
MEMQQQDLFQELESWENIIHSEDWRVFLKLLATHKDFLQAQVNGYLVSHEDRKASEALAKLNDCDQIIRLVSKRIEEIRKKMEGKE